MNPTVQDLLHQDKRIKDFSEMKSSITSVYNISDVPKYDIIWSENSDVIDSFISEILKYKSWILASWCKRSWTVGFTPSHTHMFACVYEALNISKNQNEIFYSKRNLGKFWMSSIFIRIIAPSGNAIRGV